MHNVLKTVLQGFFSHRTQHMPVLRFHQTRSSKSSRISPLQPRRQQQGRIPWTSEQEQVGTPVTFTIPRMEHTPKRTICSAALPSVVNSDHMYSQSDTLCNMPKSRILAAEYVVTNHNTCHLRTKAKQTDNIQAHSLAQQ